MLTIDIGNTRIKWGVWREDVLVESGGQVYGTSGLELGDSLDRCFESLSQQAVVVASCVAGDAIRESVRQWFASHWQCQLRFVAVEPEGFGVINGYDQWQQLGVDRWLAIIAAYRKYPGHPLCVIDAGTAITLDVVEKEGRHLGGLIMPGLNMMCQSLHQGTHAIGQVNQARQTELGRSTPNAVLSGCLGLLRNGLAGLCRAHQDRYEGELLHVVTGGDAEKVVGDIPGDCRLEPNLILYGLRLLADTRD